MKALFNFLKTTLLGGIFFLLPLIVFVLLLGKAFYFLAKIFRPLAKLLPFSSVAGIPISYLMAVLLLIGVGFLAGLLAKTKWGKRLRKAVEQVLNKIPGYALLHVFSQDLETTQQGISSSPVGLFHWGQDNWQWCFIIERHDNGHSTIFLPGSPKPNSGAVRLVPSGQVKEVDIPMRSVLKCLTQSGVGSQKLSERFLKNAEDR